MDTFDARPSPEPRISICVVTYNHERVIRECLQSLVDQKSRWPFEVLVGEDCSTDSTRLIVEEFALRYPGVVKPLLPEQNLGMFSNYRTVHAAAQGEFVCHCDGDDYWEPGKLEAQIEFLDAYPECVAVFSNSSVISDDGARLGFFSAGVPPTFDTSYLIKDGNFLHHSSMMYRSRWRSAVIPAEGPFCDYQIYVLLARHGLLGYIDRPLTAYRTQSSSSAIRQDNGGVRRLVWQALLEVAPGDASRDAIRRSHATFLADATFHALRCGRPAGFVEWLALMRKNGRAGSWRTQLLALYILLAGILNKLAFSTRVRLGRTQPDARVFYPK